MNIGIVVSDWNKHITHKLYEGCFETLIKHGAQEEHLHTIQVPGAFELTMGARIVTSGKRLDAVICLGCVIKGETDHDKYINHAVAAGLTNLGMMANIPMIYGVLTPNTEEQARERAGGKYGNKGVEAAVTAIRMANLKKTKGGKVEKKGIGFY